MKWFWWYILVVIGVLIAGRVYLHSGFPYTHDGENHLARFANYKIALKEGQVPPRFAPNLMNRYGYPVFNYNYPLANILSVPFSVAHIPYETTFKFLAIIAISLMVIGVANWLYFLQISRAGQFAGVLAMVTSPVVLNMTFFRGNIGELWALALMALMLWQIEQQLQKKSSVGWLICLWTALLLSHNITAVFAVPTIWLYSLVRSKQLKIKLTSLRPQLFAFFMGMLLVAWFWIPALMEKGLIILDSAALTNLYTQHFARLPQIISAPMQFGFSYPGSIDTLSFGLGYTIIASLVIAVAALLKKAKDSIALERSFEIPNWLMWFIIATLGFIWLQLPISETLWNIVPVLKYAQFPWRFGLFAVLYSLPVIGWSLSTNTLRPQLKLLLWLVLFVQTIQSTQLKAVDYFHRTTQDYDAYSQSTSTQNENRSKQFNYLEIGDWQPTAKILTGQGEVKTLIWRGSNRTYQVSAKSAVTVVEPTMNFAGWQTTANGKIVDYLDSASISGRLAYQLEPGDHSIHSSFTQHTWARILGNSISVLTLFSLIASTCYSYIHRKHDKS